MPDPQDDPPPVDTVPADVWIVVPAYNEGPRLADTLAGLSRLGGTVVVVDDGSDDDTAAIATAAGVRVVRHPINLGQGAALQTGFDAAVQSGARVVVTFDGDGQHQPSDVAAIAQPALTGKADVVLGSRFLESQSEVPPLRRCLLRGGVVFTRAVSRVRVTDTHNGLRAFTAETLRTLRITQPRMAHASELLDEIARHRLRYVEVPVEVRYRDDLLAKGQSNWAAIRIVAEFLLGRLTR